jgi:tight adherence protein B
MEERLDRYSKAEKKIIEDLPEVVRSGNLSEIPALNKLLKKFEFSQYFYLALEQAGMPTEVGKLILKIFIFSLVGLIVSYRSENISIIFLSFLAGGFFPLGLVLNRRRKRRRLFEENFPDALDMLQNGVKAGFGIVKGMQLVAEESPDPVGTEFKRTFEEINLGIEMRDALMNFSRRIDSMDLRLFVAALMIQKESGGNLAEILKNISNTIRERFKLIGQIRVFTAQGRFSGLVLGLLPMIFGLLVHMVNPEYITPLFTTPSGRKILMLAILLQLIGYFFIRRILKIKLI